MAQNKLYVHIFTCFWSTRLRGPNHRMLESGIPEGLDHW
jgi:hypothetical protein